ncbi:MAG TPA: response regulator transcription factor [Spirochaetia bacterium]|nr:response regulator transcription factor [Spirochaetia bacterium]
MIESHLKTNQDITVLLADDHSVVRDGVKAVIKKLDPHIRIVGEAGNGREVLTQAEQGAADVYVIDVAMPGLNGIETLERLLRMRPRSKVLMLSMYADKVLVEKAMKKGARGYVLKESTSEEIVNAIHEVHRGHFYLSPGIAGYMVEGFLHNGDGSGPEVLESTLTSRQREILQLICEGMTERHIAEALNLSPHTIHVHKNNIMKKLNIHTKAGLIKHAIKQGIVQI